MWGLRSALHGLRPLLGHTVVNRDPFLQWRPGLLSTELSGNKEPFVGAGFRCFLSSIGLSGEGSPERHLHEFHFLITKALGAGAVAIVTGDGPLY